MKFFKNMDDSNEGNHTNNGDSLREFIAEECAEQLRNNQVIVVSMYKLYTEDFKVVLVNVMNFSNIPEPTNDHKTSLHFHKLVTQISVVVDTLEWHWIRGLSWGRHGAAEPVF